MGVAASTRACLPLASAVSSDAKAGVAALLGALACTLLRRSLKACASEAGMPLAMASFSACSTPRPAACAWLNRSKICASVKSAAFTVAGF